MSRDIKFRAWDEVGKQWIYLDLVDLVTNQLERQGFSSMRVVNWCRWTGLLDKNGKEIFEGDIVRSNKGRTTRPVYWLEGQGLIGFNISSKFECEVIGNIYENPELLK